VRSNRLFTFVYFFHLLGMELRAMSKSLIYVRRSAPSNSEDADLAARVGQSLTQSQRPGWFEIYVAVRNGLVTLDGKVSSERNRKLVVNATERVAGVRHVKDELQIVEMADVVADDVESDSFFEHQRAAKPTGRPEQFQHLPVVEESLEDILSSPSKPISSQLNRS
jgi:hypothetical protein